MTYTIDTDGWLDPHLAQEWLLTNGIGSFAGSTILCCNTRRYHGLLCAATNPPVGRVMTLSRVAESLSFEGDSSGPVELSINQFGAVLHPRGDQLLQRVKVDNVVRWEYAVRGGLLVKELLLAWGSNKMAIRYTWTGPTMQLGLMPFVSLRDFHALRHAGANLPCDVDPKSVRVRSEGSVSVNLFSDRAVFIQSADWWYGHTYPVEIDRGQDSTEDLFAPGRFIVEMTSGASVTFAASTDSIASFDWDGELAKRKAAFAVDPKVSSTVGKLLRSAKDFIVARKQPNGEPGQTIIAGYPWFADWGRDTMISLPGLLLVSRRFAEAKQVLSVFSQYVSEGMIPNRFNDYSNEPEYNTVDASLWFIHAAFEYLAHSRDQAGFNAQLLPACKQIINGYRNGTRFNIGMDPADSLITQGDATTQLTWMDAKCGDIAFTPRQGKAVEINALWYHALRLLSEDTLADKVQKSFARAFWLDEQRGLADVIDGGRRDESIRPNQIFAVSLPNSPLDRTQQKAVVEVVRRELLTPFGLRTLDRHNLNYHPQYTGPQVQRDAAYHNGTVWPWPIGAFLDAYLNVYDSSPAAMTQARNWLAPLIDGMSDTACIGSISEIYEPELPFRPVGCYAQAWSVAEVLRLAVRLGL